MAACTRITHPAHCLVLVKGHSSRRCMHNDCAMCFVSTIFAEAQAASMRIGVPTTLMPPGRAERPKQPAQGPNVHLTSSWLSCATRSLSHLRAHQKIQSLSLEEEDRLYDPDQGFGNAFPKPVQRHQAAHKHQPAPHDEVAIQILQQSVCTCQAHTQIYRSTCSRQGAHNRPCCGRQMLPCTA